MRPSWSWRVLCLLDSEVREAVERFLFICSHCLVNISVWKFINYSKDFNQSLWSLCGLTQRILPPYNLQDQKCMRRGCHNAGEGPSSLPLHREWLSPAHWLWQVSLTDKLLERCNTRSCNDISILHERNLCFNKFNDICLMLYLFISICNLCISIETNKFMNIYYSPSPQQLYFV